MSEPTDEQLRAMYAAGQDDGRAWIAPWQSDERGMRYWETHMSAEYRRMWAYVAGEERARVLAIIDEEEKRVRFGGRRDDVLPGILASIRRIRERVEGGGK